VGSQFRLLAYWANLVLSRRTFSLHVFITPKNYPLPILARFENLNTRMRSGLAGLFAGTWLPGETLLGAGMNLEMIL
jgi:hypothetical protein